MVDDSLAIYESIRGLVVRELNEIGMTSRDAAKIVAAVPDADISRAVEGVFTGKSFAFALEFFRCSATGKAKAIAFITNYEKHAPRPDGHYGVSSVCISLDPIVEMAFKYRGGNYAPVIH